MVWTKMLAVPFQLSPIFLESQLKLIETKIIIILKLISHFSQDVHNMVLQIYKT